MSLGTSSLLCREQSDNASPLTSYLILPTTCSIKGTYFITPQFVDAPKDSPKPAQLPNKWPHVVRLAAAGHEVGAHTTSHRNFGMENSKEFTQEDFSAVIKRCVYRPSTLFNLPLSLLLCVCVRLSIRPSLSCPILTNTHPYPPLTYLNNMLRIKQARKGGSKLGRSRLYNGLSLRCP